MQDGEDLGVWNRSLDAGTQRVVGEVGPVDAVRVAIGEQGLGVGLPVRVENAVGTRASCFEGVEFPHPYGDPPCLGVSKICLDIWSGGREVRSVDVELVHRVRD